MSARDEPKVLICVQDPLVRGVLVRQFFQGGWDVLESSRSEDAERRAVQFLPQVTIVSLENSVDIVFLLKRWSMLPSLRTSRVILEVSELVPREAEQFIQAGAAAIFVRGHYTPEDVVRRAAKEHAHFSSL